MRKGGYYVNNTLFGEVDKGSWQGNELTSEQVKKLIVRKDRVTREVNKETSWRVNELIVEEVKITEEQG